jgi:hypothetical protein
LRVAFHTLFVIAVAVLVAASARATEVIHLDTRALTLGSSDIVVGAVESITPRWNEQHTKIVTDVAVRVTQSLKGASAETLTLTQLGGTVGNMRYTVPGCPAWRTGEEALLFVWRDSHGRPQVNGLAQGKFDITRDAASGERMVQRSLEGLAVRDVQQLRLVPSGQMSPRLKLRDLVGEIQRTLAEGGR